MFLEYIVKLVTIVFRLQGSDVKMILVSFEDWIRVGITVC